MPDDNSKILEQQYKKLRKRPFMLGVIVVFLFVALMLSSYITQSPLRFKSEAAGVVDLTLVPSTTTVSPGQEFDVFININPNDTQITGAEVHIAYDTTRLETTTTAPIILPSSSAYLSRILPNCSTSTAPNCPASSSVQNGVASIYLGVPCATTGCTLPVPVSAPTLLAVLHLRAKAGISGQAAISFVNLLDTEPPTRTTRITVMGQANSNQLDEVVDTAVMLPIPVSPSPILPTPSPTPVIIPTATPRPNASPTPAPTPASSGGQTLINVTEDAYVWQRTATNNYGVTAALSTQGGTQPRIVYMKLNLSGVNPASVHTARLNMRVMSGSQNTHSIKLLTSSSWSETTINFNNRPATANAPVILQMAAPRNQTTYSADLTNTVRTYAGQTITLVFEQNGDQVTTFASSETGNPPQLVIQ